MSSKYALIIGNTEYADPGLAQLTAPGRDAEDFARVLKDKNLCEFDDVRVLLNQVSSAIIEAIDEFFDLKKPDDLLVLYFSGHGVRDELGALYLAVKNTIRSRLRSTAIKSDYIREVMDQSRSRRQVLVLDCCNSGAFQQGTKAATGMSVGTATAFEGGYGRIILTASDSTQFAWEGDKVIGETDNSLFTHFLVEGLEGEADMDGDGRITVDELYDYAYEKVKFATPKQTPSKFSTKQQGEIVLRQNIRVENIKPVALPDDLLDEIDDTRPYVREAAVQKLEKILKSRNIGLARSAREALGKIAADDDSRRVSQTALQVLESYKLVEEKAEAERRAREEADRLAALKAEEERLMREKAEAERRAKEEAEKLQRAKAEREAAEREAARLKAERKAAELAAREATEKAAKEKEEKEAAEREAVQKAEQEAIELASRKKAERKAAEKAEREAEQLVAQKKAEREAKDEVGIKDSKPYKIPLLIVIVLIVGGIGLLSSIFAAVQASADAKIQATNFANAQTNTAVNPGPTETESLLWITLETFQSNNSSSLLAYENGDDIFITTLDGAVINKIPGKSVSCLFPPSISPGGNMIAIIGSRGIELVNIQNPEQVESEIRTIGLPIGLSWSPDGKYVVFADGSSGPEDLYIADIDGPNIQNITNNGEYNAYPDWSPNGKEIAFTSTRDQVDGIYVINQNGQLRSIATYTTGTPYAPRWSLDGTKIAYVFDHVGTDGYYDYSQVFVVEATGDQSPVPITDPLYGWEPGAVGWAYPPVWFDNKTVFALNYYDGWYSLSIDGIDPELLDEQIPGSCADFLP